MPEQGTIEWGIAILLLVSAGLNTLQAETPLHIFDQPKYSGTKAARKRRQRPQETIKALPLGKDWRIHEDKSKFHIFILYGQSNMAGGIPGKELTKEDKTPVPHIVLRRGKGWIPAAHPLHLGGKKNGFGLGLPFAEEYLKNHPGVTVGLVPCASGGKRIDLLKKGSNLYRAAMGKSRLALETGTIKGILWHQGESDTVTDERADCYEKKLHQLIADMREDLKTPNLPFIVGDLAQLYGIGENRKVPPAPEKID